MGGLGKVLKMYGEMTVTDKDGNKVVWVWDYAEEKARIKSEMTKEQFAKSEKAKYLNNFTR
jgi:major membrane immunogen (membrane-anchored lipoprotein)